MKTNEQRLVVTGGRKIRGEITVSGAKNGVLPILAASLLCKTGTVTLHNCPLISDVYSSSKILTGLGCKCKLEGHSITVDARDALGFKIPDQLASEMRSSVFYMGAMLGRNNACEAYPPGGCDIGERSIDWHIEALESMGIHVTEEHGKYICSAYDGIHGARISLRGPSVGVTENIMLAAVTAKGETVITNAAKEPEIADLAKFLNACGAKIIGAGESEIVIEGVSSLHGCEHTIIPDRIVATTYMAAAVSTYGEVTLRNVNPKHLKAIISTFEKIGSRIKVYDDTLTIYAGGGINSIKEIITSPYPGFPTDAQAVLMAVLAKAKQGGVSIFTEKIFENRFIHVPELRKLGADIIIKGDSAIVYGRPRLTGAEVKATDLRAGAGMVIAALGADGVTEISKICHIDRGYEDFEGNLKQAGAEIARR